MQPAEITFVKSIPQTLFSLSESSYQTPPLSAGPPFALAPGLDSPDGRL